MKYLIFDFNGTIIDDVELNYNIINELRKIFINEEPCSMEEYKDAFTFPIKKMYENLGFDFYSQDWNAVAHKWLELYTNSSKHYKLYDGVIELLIKNRKNGNKNILLSASRSDVLIKQCKDMGIETYFDEILGIDDIYATSKKPIGINFMKGKNPDDCVMIGDTLHDEEVADVMGIKCILVSSGHQSKKVLKTGHSEVIDNIKELKV